MNSLLNLYVSVLVPVFSEWTKLEDLCFLDSAVCNSSLRTGFLETLKVCYCTDVMKEADKSFDWVMLRGLRVKKFCLDCFLLKVTPVVETILRSRQLLLLEGVDLGDVELLVERFSVDTTVLQVKLQQNFDALLLKKIGHRLTRIDLPVYKTIDDFNIIAACCPKLKEFSAPENSFILPIVDACELDVINKCHLGSLVKRQECDWTYWCDVVRTTVVDETAVCLGEGKYYHMTNLLCRPDLTNKDVELLTPLLTQLREISLYGAVNNILAACVERCFKLTRIDVSDIIEGSSVLRSLLQQSSKLRFLIFTGDQRFTRTIDDFFDVVPFSCPLLESCVMNFGAVTSAETMSSLFRYCICLTEVVADWWHYKAGADGLEYLSVDRSVGFVFSSHRYGRGLKRLSIEGEVSEDVLMEILSKNPNLRFVQLSLYRNKSLIKSYIDVTKGDNLVTSLGRCQHLTTLTLYYFIGLSAVRLSAVLENKETLQSLTLYDCSVSSDMVAIIGDYCSALTYLSLSYNKAIQSGDIIALLQRCCKLEQLKLNYCAGIGPEILSSIKSPPMKHLSVFGTRINATDIRDIDVVMDFDRYKGLRWVH